jgi:phosphinothricin acetyltransferase
MLTIRPATLTDIPAITDIYNEAVLHTRNTFDTVARTVAEREAWYKQHMPNYPILVAEVAGQVIGFASLSQWSERPAYSKTVVVSIYLHQDFRGQKIGKKLLQAVVEAAYEAGFHTIMGNVYAGNAVSLRLMESAGFRVVGLLKEVGYKFDEWLDVYLVQHLKESEK